MGFFKTLLHKKDKVQTLTIKTDYTCPPVTILYGTKTGNAQLIAQQAHKYFGQCGLESECFNMEKYDAGRLPSEKHLLVVVSTDAEGELPPNARLFYRFLQSEEMPQLSNLKYSICALGDSNYDYFCGGGKTIDKQLIKLGAKHFVQRTDCDIDFKKPALQWIQNCFDTIVGIKKEPLNTIEPEVKNKALTAQLSKRYKLSNDKTEQAIYHVELDNSQLKIAYSAGDCIEVIPTNPQKLVDKILSELSFNPGYMLRSLEQTMEQALLHNFELTKLSRPVIRRYLNIFSIGKLNQLYSNRSELKKYIDEADILDLLVDFPSNINEEQFIGILQPLHSRYYSIASGSIANPDKIDLTIKTIRFENKQRQYEGAGSIFMNEGLKEGSSIDFRIVKNPSFHLPNNNETPVILIGVGTGLAPYRAFLQDLKAKGITNKAWLIWGDKQEENDFIYRDELLAYTKDETLAQLNTAFSRDQDEKRYVHHIIAENKSQIMQWLNNGAHIYLCGHNQMGDAVKNTLIDIFESEQSLSNDEAKAHLKQLRDNNIIHEDLY